MKFIQSLLLVISVAAIYSIITLNFFNGEIDAGLNQINFGIIIGLLILMISKK
ncbi:hypothetical protein [Paenibacillus xerothermodurans]|uniref:hypothetical protein n=1 Tax=Paenibacillus xerothermodurans TaxID=1977292 RepID=UPI001401EBB7|nr:hypothetical protein [Paenibacillus xerothermodurans]